MSLRVTTGENLGLPQRFAIDERERELITSLYPSLRKIAAVAGSVDVEPDDLVQEAVVPTLKRGPLTDLDSFKLFAESGELADEYIAADCSNTRSPECANLIIENLDDWAAWYQTNN